MDNIVSIEGFKLVGLKLAHKTSNENGQSGIDCGSLWTQFEVGEYVTRIPIKLSDDIIAVYYDYEGDYTKPFSYFIGCKVKDSIEIPEDMDSLTIPSGRYNKFIAEGKMPDCVANVWKGIWSSDIDRAYICDFEVYGEASKDWQDAKLEIFVSVK